MNLSESNTYVQYKNTTHTNIHNDIFDKWLPILDAASSSLLFIFAYTSDTWGTGYAYLMDRSGGSKNTIYNAVDTLLKNELIEVVEPMTPNQAWRWMLAKKDKINIGFKGSNEFLCNWCHIPTLILHNHHFPIPLKDGGVENVKICANCHCEFHYLVDSKFFRLTEDLRC